MEMGEGMNTPSAFGIHPSLKRGECPAHLRCTPPLTKRGIIPLWQRGARRAGCRLSIKQKLKK